MATASPVAASVTPMSAWEIGSPLAEFTTPRQMAGCVAWDVVTHLQGYGLDLALIYEMDLPPGCEAEDMQDVLYELVVRAGEIGYIIAKLDIPGIDIPWEGARITDKDLARAVIALMKRTPVKDGEAFEPMTHPGRAGRSRDASSYDRLESPERPE